MSVSEGQQRRAGMATTAARFTRPDTELLHRAAEEVDELVVAVHGADVNCQKLVDVLPALIDAALSGDARLSFVGGAGSSLVSPDGPRLVDTPDFALAYVDEIEHSNHPRQRFTTGH